MAKKKSKFKSIIKFILDLRKTERGKAILFLGFYFVFFLVLIIFIRVSSNNYKGPLYELYSEEARMYTYDKILAENYNYTYTISIDDNVYVYNGQKYNNMELFTFNDVNYFFDGVDYYIIDSVNNMFIKVDNPNKLSDFTTFLRLGEVIEDATYVSKTEFGDGKTLFNYLISSNSMIKVLDDIDTDIDEVPNSVVFNTSGDNLHIDSIDLDLTSYGKYKNICLNSLKINISYYNFGEVLEIVSPFK